MQPRPQTVEMLSRLVGFDTQSHKSNLFLIDFVRDYLDALGARCVVIPSADGDKANLLASFGPIEKGGIILSGHTDVVPALPEEWRSDPFVLTQRGERFFGRGACDMKGFIAVVLAAAPKFANADLTQPVHIALSYDEELGCSGVPSLIEALRRLPERPRACIVGEPTLMRVAIGHKGARAFRADFVGLEAHSSLAPNAVNAVEYASQFVVRLRDLGLERSRVGPFDVGYDIGHTTVHTGVIRGGVQVNVVPSHCMVEFEFRALPEEDADALEAQIRRWVEDEIGPEMTARGKGCGVRLERRYGYSGLKTPEDDDVVALATELCDDGAPPIKIAFGTEAGMIHDELGIPTVVCGPGSIGQAHQPDEFVSASQLVACEEFMDRLLQKL